MTYIFKSCYRNSSSHLQPPDLGLFFLSSSQCSSALFSSSSSDGSQLDGPHCPQSQNVPWPVPSALVLWSSLSSTGFFTQGNEPVAQEKMVLIELEHQEPGMTTMAQTLLLPPSPYSSQHLSQANCNLLFCYSQFSLHVWRNILDNTAPRSSALSTHTGLQPLPSAEEVGHSPSSGMFFLIRGHTASCSLSLKGGGELSSMWLGHHPDLAGHCHHQPAHHWQLWVKPSAMQTPAVSKSHAEITLCSSLSYSYVLLSTPQTTVFCSTHQYYTRAFLAPCFCHRLPLAKNVFLL